MLVWSCSNHLKSSYTSHTCHTLPWSSPRFHLVIGPSDGFLAEISPKPDGSPGSHGIFHGGNFKRGSMEKVEKTHATSCNFKGTCWSTRLLSNDINWRLFDARHLDWGTPSKRFLYFVDRLLEGWPWKSHSQAKRRMSELAKLINTSS